MEIETPEKQGKYAQTFGYYCLKRPFLCRHCKTVNACFTSAAINDKNWFSIRIGCQACGNYTVKGPYSIEEMKMLARMTSRERHFDLAYVWHCFLMIAEYPEKLESLSMLPKYRAWRETILAAERKRAASYDSLWADGGYALHEV
jgi:hypothetical protein